MTDQEGIGLMKLVEKYRDAKLITDEFDDIYNYVERLMKSVTIGDIEKWERENAYNRAAFSSALRGNQQLSFPDAPHTL